MTIDEAKVAKRECEEMIRKAILQFESATGLAVRGVDLQWTYAVGSKHPAVIGCSLDARL